jgi:hypothetical protein
MRSKMTTLMVGLGAAALALVAVPSPSAAQAERAHLGLRAGYNFELEEPAVGGHFAVPIVRQLDFYPSLDVFLPETGTRMLFNGDLKYRFATASAWGPYMGGGLNMRYRRVAGSGNSDLGGNLLAGIETRAGNVHPFFEGRLVMMDDATFQLLAGLNFTLGR